MSSFVVKENRPIRVLYVVPGSPDGLSMVFAHAEIARIAASEFETKTFMFDAGSNLWRAWIEMRALRQLIRDYRPDIVHAHFGTLTSFVCALVSHVPLVITYRGSDLNYQPSDGVLRNAVQKLLSQLAALRAREIICVSQRLRDRLWWCREKVVVIPSGVDLNLFQPIPRTVARKALGWRDDERIVLFNAGRTPAVKRMDLAEASVAVVRKLVGEVRFVVLRGDIDHNEMPLYHSGADCLLVTSDSEGSPDIVKEALACGLPIVSVEVGDVTERIDGVRPSRIVARDPRAIGSAAAEIVVSGERSNGREAIRELSSTVVRDKILDVYSRVLGDGRQGCAQ